VSILMTLTFEAMAKRCVESGSIEEKKRRAVRSVGCEVVCALIPPWRRVFERAKARPTRAVIVASP
jgi:hypothetical protein